MNAILENHLSFSSDTKKYCYLILKNKIDDLYKLSLWIEEVSILFNLSDDLIFKIDLTLNELLFNIISYAYSNPCDSDIFIQCYYSNNMIEINIEDDGMPFNPLEQSEAILPNSLEEADIGGLGILIVRHYIDQCTYQRKNNRNIFTMRFTVSQSINS